MPELNLGDVMSNAPSEGRGLELRSEWPLPEGKPLGWNTWLTGSRDSPAEPGGSLDFSIAVMENH